MTSRSFKMVPLAALCAVASFGAHAGTVSSGVSKNVSLVIGQATGASWDLSSEVSSMMAFDAATGTVSLVAPSAPVSDVDGVWTPGATTTLANGQTVTGLGWHSWLTASGVNAQGASANASDPWASSLILTQLTGQIDPSMNYGFYVKNNTSSTQTYAFNYGESIVPTIVGAYTITADISGSMSNVDGSTTVGLVQQVLLSGDSGLTSVNAGVDVGGTVTQSGTSVYGPYSASSSGVASGTGYNYWSFATNFALSGNKDIFVASGAATITAVPEPGSLALLCAGLGVVALIGRRRLA